MVFEMIAETGERHDRNAWLASSRAIHHQYQFALS